MSELSESAKMIMAVCFAIVVFIGIPVMGFLLIRRLRAAEKTGQPLKIPGLDAYNRFNQTLIGRLLTSAMWLFLGVNFLGVLPPQSPEKVSTVSMIFACIFLLGGFMELAGLIKSLGKKKGP